MCFINSKCNWCNKRKTDVYKIKFYCKWYNYNICIECYNYKSINTTNTINVLASYHPAYLLRSPQFKKEAWIDLKILREKLNNEN